MDGEEIKFWRNKVEFTIKTSPPPKIAGIPSDWISEGKLKKYVFCNDGSK